MKSPIGSQIGSFSVPQPMLVRSAGNTQVLPIEPPAEFRLVHPSPTLRTVVDPRLLNWIPSLISNPKLNGSKLDSPSLAIFMLTTVSSARTIDAGPVQPLALVSAHTLD